MTDEIAAVVADVRSFLDGLRRELPALFRPSARRQVPFQGRELALRLESCARARTVVVEEPEGLVIRRGEDGLRPRDALRAWYQGKARELFAERTGRFGAAMGVTYGRVSVKDQRSLWGSCSRGGDLNFNWRLVLAPPGVLDYLVVHELAHRKEMNHSKRFWAVVEAHSPAYRDHRRWLREHARTLRRA